ncbi:MAG: hypothetical protein PVS3B3_17230 [Ktedonobacteraceae bacterium]
MQTQDKQTLQATSSVQKSKRTSWLTSLGILMLISLLVGLGATVLAYSRTLHNNSTAPKAVTWQRVLDGYSIVLLTAAPSNPAVLYACGTPVHPSTPVPYRPSQPTISYTLLRSADSGTTWQEVTLVSADCQLAINPAQSNDIYVVGLAGHRASNGQVPTVLSHSTDGGRSWIDIAPTFDTGNPQLSIAWHVQQLTMVGSRLFGIQLLPAARLQPIVKPSPVTIATRLDLSRLVESSDGGHTWTILDSNLNVTGQGTYDYMISPSEPQTVYELIGPGWFPYITPSMQKNMPTYGRNLSLYKTTNDGGTWTKLRENIHYGSKIQLASSNPSLVFVGGSTGILLSPREPDVALLPGYFSLAVSKDGGATWSTIKQPDEGSFVQNWFVSADGQVYLASGVAISGQPTGTIGTIVPVGTEQMKPVGNIATINQRIPEGSTTTIQRYDVTNGTWSIISKTPSSGTLLSVTTSATLHKTTLWFLSDDNNAQVLYREIL